MERWLEKAQIFFPIHPRPFSKLAEEFKKDEGELIETLRRLKDEGIIRRIGAVLEPRKLGAEPVLLALEVDGEKVEEVGRETARYREVTHCYEREPMDSSQACPYNLWLVLTAEKERRRELMERFKALEGVKDLLVLESEEVYKLRAVFR
ncbi:TPA: Lrp/AsnC family transcriptional regulator [Candidatus Poribacteria bacterium]|nr:Lrp/AsnC family transcriptional regulator [Candidatus Poribacteria bacterium]HEX30568.1 Lrp/AsnC family transcriptional regulator [Candidatus Poribacteria bacterium]